ncbi:hypothetical protein [Lentzea sp. NEAU-D7]|uniref:hypothetical protein n=1 Tax=Lentzea sp. NEAU-D7 TaxID=2994667 RepID=UPI00224B70B6|nr:hypothetical protein [Lentzea sp. NEAU-D7]MCX2948905.1 hypothetical protein [Lentzea sp. NEAU-D7]
MVPTKTDIALRTAGMVADVLRGAVLVGAVYAALVDEVEGGIRLGLVFAILLAPRLAGLPRPFDLAVCILLPLAAAASLFHWYREIIWLDWVLHCLCTGALAAMTYLLLLRTPLLPHQRHHGRSAVVFLTTVVGLALGVFWEFYEWYAEVVAGVRIGVGYSDTIADLAMDTLGSIAAGLALMAWLANGRNPFPNR